MAPSPVTLRAPESPPCRETAGVRVMAHHAGTSDPPPGSLQAEAAPLSVSGRGTGPQAKQHSGLVGDRAANF